MTEAAFRTLYNEFRDPLFRFGYRLTGSAEVAEDNLRLTETKRLVDSTDERRWEARH